MANRQVAETLGTSDLRSLISQLSTIIKEHGHAINLLLVSQDEGSNILTLVDGVAAPTAIAGVAQVYVDIADGDLKVMFGDGTVKVIETNP